MSSKKTMLIKYVMLATTCVVLTANIPKEYKAETTGIAKKTILLKTSELKVEKTIIAAGPEVLEANSMEDKVSREANSIAYDILDYAYEQIGAPYGWGASGPNAFDCSGFTSYIFSGYGIYLPRTAASQYYAGYEVTMGELQPGDLVFFNTYTSLGHVGIYIGGGDFIHAADNGVRISSIYGPYYSDTYAGAVRVL